jgi:hypothetical protein
MPGIKFLFYWDDHTAAGRAVRVTGKVNPLPGELNLEQKLLPVPQTAKFINDSSYIWCGTLVKSHIDQKYHLFYSRWPREYGMYGLGYQFRDCPCCFRFALWVPLNLKMLRLPHRGK